MNGFLLDTNIISMLSPSRAAAPDAFLDWLERADADGQVFLSVVTVHEIEKGIALLEHRGATTKASGLMTWLTGLIAGYGDRILSLDVQAAAIAGKMEASAIAAGHDPGMADAAVAGIAKAHDLAVVTRNGKHFRPFDIAVLLPEEAVRLA